MKAPSLAWFAARGWGRRAPPTTWGLDIDGKKEGCGQNRKQPYVELLPPFGLALPRCRRNELCWLNFQSLLRLSDRTFSPWEMLPIQHIEVISYSLPGLLLRGMRRLPEDNVFLNVFQIDGRITREREILRKLQMNQGSRIPLYMGR